jgi:FAD/FMN-containing dehydrogenase
MSTLHGLAVDQLLEAQVVLPNGTLVTANANNNSEIFWAIRGGGPGTTGVVTSATVKTYPTVNVTEHLLILTPLTDNFTDYFAALSTYFTELPRLSDAGFQGYGQFNLVDNSSFDSSSGSIVAGYGHAYVVFNSTPEAVTAAFQPTLDKLRLFNSSSLYVEAFIDSTWSNYSSYYSETRQVGSEAVAYNAVVGSRLLPRDSLENNTEAISHALQDILNPKPFPVSGTVLMVAGGQVNENRNLYTAVNPAWRNASVHVTIGTSYPDYANQTVVDASWDEITLNRTEALRSLAPDSGCYMNEASRYEPDWQWAFYGSNYPELAYLKKQLDPEGVMYCPTCVGSEEWVEKDDGRLCKADWAV